jgi:DNA-binding NarL/FixJ family response regulator
MPLGHVIKLLLADDSDVMRQTIKMVLLTEPQISIVGEASGHAEFLRLLDACRPDVVLVDVHMMNTVQAPTIQSQLSDTCLLAMSVWTDDETASLAKSYGAIQLLDKSNLVTVLIPAIKKSVQQNKEARHA